MIDRVTSSSVTVSNATYTLALSLSLSGRFSHSKTYISINLNYQLWKSFDLKTELKKKNTKN